MHSGYSTGGSRFGFLLHWEEKAGMSTCAEISPNVPDVMPEYVDGGPGPAPAAPVKTSAHARAARETALGHREGECVPNVPDVLPRFVSPEEAAAAVPAKQTAPDAGTDAVPVPAPSPWMRWCMAGTALAAALFGVLITGQIISALALAATLPLWAQYMLLIPLGLCCLVLIGVCAALIRSWLRLRAIRQVDVNALEVLRARAQTRQDGLERFQAARAGLERYLRQYPLDAKGGARLQSAGIRPEGVESLVRSRDRLEGFATDSRSWLAAFREEFQSTLDDAARKRVDVWSLKAAGCVIASPLPLLDAVLVLTISLKMIRDLCLIYNVRASRSGTFLLLNRAVAAAFVAGVAEDAAEAAGGMAAEELSGALGESALNSFGAKAAGVVAPKLGEGAINAFFVRRLGKAAIRMLQPLRPQK